MKQSPARQLYRCIEGGMIEVVRGREAYRFHVDSLRRLKEQGKNRRERTILGTLHPEYVGRNSGSIMAITNPEKEGTVKIEWGYHPTTGRPKVVEHANTPGNLMMLSGGWPERKLVVRTRRGTLLPLLDETHVREILERSQDSLPL